MSQLLPYMIFDWLVLLGVAVAFVRRASFFHPLTFYLFFHAYSFSLRAWELYSGKYPMYYGVQMTAAYYSAIQPDEFTRALLVADIGLIIFLIGTKVAGTGLKPREPRPHNDRLIVAILAILGPASAWLFLTKRFEAEGITDVIREYQILNIISIWPIACIALAIARWGFKWYWSAAALVYLALVATQGYHRFMALLPLILLVGIYLARKKLAWPGPAVWVVLIAGALAFPTLKDLGPAVQERGIAGLSVAFEGQRAGESDLTSTRTEMFFDQFAGALTLADQLEQPLLGGTYYAILTLPIPRSWWPDKPSLGGSASSIAAPGRPFDVEGRIVTVLGESYINFRYIGIAIIMFLLGFLLTRFYLSAFSVGALDSFKLAYLGTLTTFLQVFRDGVPSLLLFSVVVMFPLFLYAFLNSWSHSARGRFGAVQLIGRS